MLPVPDLTACGEPRDFLPYLAGFFDGEGCVRIHRGIRRKGATARYYLEIVVTQKYDNRGPLEEAKAMFGGWLGRVKSREGCQPMARWQVDGPKAAVILQALLPYLRVKRPAVYAGLAFQHFQEVMGTTRKKHSPISEFEREIGEGFCKVFYVLNGNKSIEDAAELAKHLTEIPTGEEFLLRK